MQEPPAAAPARVSKEQSLAAHEFQASPRDLEPFSAEDPFNSRNIVVGYLCKKPGPYYGSLYIYEVNDERLEAPEIVHGTPTMLGPSLRDGDLVFPQHQSYTLAPKWNGLNVLVYKYYDARGACHVSAKPRVQPFLTGSALAFVKQLLIEPAAKTMSLNSLPQMLARLANKKIQSLSFELCGSEVPHLVRYEFPLLLKPLFCTTVDGKIYPMASAEDKDLVFTGQYDPKLSSLCMQRRQEDLERNELFRTQRRLRKCHWIGHFATEGSVLYLLDKNGGLAHREGFMLKIKPSDIEAVHAVQIDQDVQQHLLEQIAPRLLPQAPPPSATELMQLLGLPHGAWELHCRDIFALMHWRCRTPRRPCPHPRTYSPPYRLPILPLRRRCIRLQLPLLLPQSSLNGLC
jgi:hypothetical protein